jgi:hypothetical protein
MGTSPLVNRAFETLLLKSARSKWTQIDQHTKALRLSHRAELFLFWAVLFCPVFRGPYARAQLLLLFFFGPPPVFFFNCFFFWGGGGFCCGFPIYPSPKNGVPFPPFNPRPLPLPHDNRAGRRGGPEPRRPLILHPAPSPAGWSPCIVNCQAAPCHVYFTRTRPRPRGAQPWLWFPLIGIVKVAIPILIERPTKMEKRR